MLWLELEVENFAPTSSTSSFNISTFAGGGGNPSAVTVNARENLLVDFGFLGVPTAVTVSQFDVRPDSVSGLLPFAAAALVVLAGVLAYSIRRRRAG